MATEFMHIGLTVSDIDRAAEFYAKYFGFRKGASVCFGEDFIAASDTLYRQPAGTWSDMQMLESDFGIVLELFRFSNVEGAGPGEWNKTGYHHISFKVDDITSMYQQMTADGIEFFFAPKKRDPNDTSEHGHWVFFKDPDGNMIEMWD